MPGRFDPDVVANNQKLWRGIHGSPSDFVDQSAKKINQIKSSAVSGDFTSDPVVHDVSYIKPLAAQDDPEAPARSRGGYTARGRETLAKLHRRHGGKV